MNWIILTILCILALIGAITVFLFICFLILTTYKNKEEEKTEYD